MRIRFTVKHHDRIMDFHTREFYKIYPHPDEDGDFRFTVVSECDCTFECDDCHSYNCDCARDHAEGEECNCLDNCSCELKSDCDYPEEHVLEHQSVTEVLEDVSGWEKSVGTGFLPLYQLIRMDFLHDSGHSSVTIIDL